MFHVYLEHAMTGKDHMQKHEYFDQDNDNEGVMWCVYII